MARNDTARRAINEALRPGDVWAEEERWLPCVLEAQRHLNLCKHRIERPAGLEENGTLVLNFYMLACSGYVKWTLRYEKGSGGYVVIGGFVTEYLPEDDRPRLAARPVQTHGKTVMVQQKVSGELARPVRVLVDATGLPVPVDPKIWAAMGLG